MPPKVDTTYYIVTGTLRSGAGVVMKMLAAGGMPIAGSGPDLELDDRTLHLMANRDGHIDSCAGRACKVMFPPLHESRIPVHGLGRWVFVRRGLWEQSYALCRLSSTPRHRMQYGLGQRRLKRALTIVARTSPLAIAKTRWQTCLLLQYEQILTDARKHARIIAEYFGKDLDIAAMARVVRIPNEVTTMISCNMQKWFQPMVLTNDNAPILRRKNWADPDGDQTGDGRPVYIPGQVWNNDEACGQSDDGGERDVHGVVLPSRVGAPVPDRLDG